MNYARLVKSIKRNEGYRPCPYKDTLGVWTIGYGSTWAAGFHGVERVQKYTPCIDKKLAEYILHTSLGDAILKAQRFAGEVWEYLTDTRREALAEMAYQLGDKVFQFKNAREALHKGDFDRVAYELKDSRWYQQTPGRVEYLAKKVLIG